MILRGILSEEHILGALVDNSVMPEPRTGIEVTNEGVDSKVSGGPWMAEDRAEGVKEMTNLVGRSGEAL